jgi:DNA primase
MTKFSQIRNDELKQKLSIGDLLRHYGGECINQASGAWWCIMHEDGGKGSGHKTPSLVAKDERGTATCMSQRCFEADDIFGVISKMENLDIKNDFSRVKEIACEVAGISYEGSSLVDNKKPSKNQIVSKGEKKKHPTEELGKKHLDYLKQIGISDTVANNFGLKARYDYILYPQLEKGETKGYKGISIIKDPKTGKSKNFFEDHTSSLFHKIEVGKGKHLIFTEGEKDCMRLSEEILKGGKDNFSALTITTGAKTVPHDLIKRLEELQPSNISIIYDNDKAGIEGSKKLAKALMKSFEEITTYSFSTNNKEGYDVADFLNEGGKFDDLFRLDKEVFKKERKAIESSYPRYVVNQDSVLDTLTPDTIIYTGYKEIDEKCPLILGENTIIVGRTGKGKTVLGVNFVNGIFTEVIFC